MLATAYQLAAVALVALALLASGWTASLAALLAKVEGRNKAQVTICVQNIEGREIDVTLPLPYPVTPQIKGNSTAWGRESGQHP